MIDSSKAALSNWKERLWDTYVRLETDSDSANFYGDVTEAVAGSPRLTLVSSTAQLTQRTSANIRSDPQDYILIAFQVEGEGFAEQSGRQAQTLPGDFVLYESTHPYTLGFTGDFKQRVLKLPLKTLDQRIPRLSSVVGRAINGRQGSGAIARQFIEELASRGHELSPCEYDIFLDVAADLVATACLGRIGDLTPDIIRFERVKARLGRLARDPSPDLERFARLESMSLRSLHRLFQLNGTTPRRVLLDFRLEGTMRDLLSSFHASRTIGEIAFSWGFTDQSYFNREFRKRFGHAPGATRQS
jgi:AraC-like DNA-binding protein